MTEAATLEDINVARQAVAKLEALIDIERRLSELDKVKNERVRGSSAMAAAIPASALLPLPAAKSSVSNSIKPSSSDDTKSVSFTSVSFGASHELNRIVGSNGRYRAIIKSGEGAEKTYRLGDKLNDGSVIQDITPTSVELKRDGKKSSLRIKGVDMVFNGK
ncbi:MAG: type II secretion system protein N [Bdellovibrionales bacterium]